MGADRGSGEDALNPGPLGRLYEAYLYEGAPRRAAFTGPPGEAALVPAQSVSWRVFANPVTLFVGGVLAVILELALPPVRAGVWDHSTFRTDPRLRLQRTGLAAMVTIYGARSAASAMIAGVNRRHARVTGVDADGVPYAATDEPLLTWVQATAAFGFGAAFSALDRSLSQGQWNALFAEGAPVARAYGALTAPADKAGWDTLLARTAPRLEGSDVLEAFLGIMAQEPVLPPVARALQAPLVRVAASLTPEAAGISLSPRWRCRPGDLALAKTAARTAGRMRIAVSPPVLAARRLGLAPEKLLTGPLPGSHAADHVP